jgi:GH43 family beta-xylosidase
MRPSAIAVVLLSCLWALHLAPAHAISCVFANPLLAAGQDPSVVFHDNVYYLVQSTAGQLTVARSDSITGLGTAESVTVYRPPSGQPYSYDLWAPELVYLDGWWYIYVAATVSPGNNPTHRMYVLKADTADPQGSWTMMGKVYDPETDYWAIDGTVFEYKGQLYMVWSGWPGIEGDFPQNLYIATMSDPLTLSSGRFLLSQPDQPWGRSVAAIQEGPEAFIHNDQLSIVYSADASWSRAYELGMLVLTGENLLDPSAWTKVGPVFSEYSDSTNSVYGPGHNSMPVTSPDGSESWLLYHAKTRPGDGWEDRAIFAQQFTWNEDGTPDFGYPIPAHVPQNVPSGETCGLLTTGSDILAPSVVDQFPSGGVFELDNDFVDTGISWINTLSSFTVTAWVQLASSNAPSAVISQDGGISSSFALEYRDNGFAFTFYGPLGDHAVSATGTTTPEVGEWYHVVGVRDTRTQELMLYVDGTLQNTVAFRESWLALGNTIIGAAFDAPLRVDLFTGIIRDIQLYSGALDPSEVRDLYEIVGSIAGNGG